MVCRPLIGWLCDVKCIDAVYIYQLVAGIDGVATLLLPLARRYFHFVLYFIVYGLADGAVGCSSCIAILSCFTSKKRSLGFGLACMVSASMAAAGPPLAGAKNKSRYLRSTWQLTLTACICLRTIQNHPQLFRYQHYPQIPKKCSGAYIFQRPFLRGSYAEKNLRYKIDWASL